MRQLIQRRVVVHALYERLVNFAKWRGAARRSCYLFSRSNTRICNISRRRLDWTAIDPGDFGYMPLACECVVKRRGTVRNLSSTVITSSRSLAANMPDMGMLSSPAIALLLQNHIYALRTLSFFALQTWNHRSMLRPIYMTKSPSCTKSRHPVLRLQQLCHLKLIWLGILSRVAC
jgi:hypothetical protein